MEPQEVEKLEEQVVSASWMGGPKVLTPRLADITWTEAGGFVSVWDLVSSKEYIRNCPLPRRELSCSHPATSATQSFTDSATLCCDQHCLRPRGQTE